MPREVSTRAAIIRQHQLSSPHVLFSNFILPRRETLTLSTDCPIPQNPTPLPNAIPQLRTLASQNTPPLLLSLPLFHHTCAVAFHEDMHHDPFRDGWAVDPYNASCVSSLPPGVIEGGCVGEGKETQGTRMLGFGWRNVAKGKEGQAKGRDAPETVASGISVSVKIGCFVT